MPKEITPSSVVCVTMGLLLAQLSELLLTSAVFSRYCTLSCTVCDIDSIVYTPRKNTLNIRTDYKVCYADYKVCYTSQISMFADTLVMIAVAVMVVWCRGGLAVAQVCEAVVQLRVRGGHVDRVLAQRGNTAVVGWMDGWVDG